MYAGLVKIGRTSTSLQQRMRELFNTSVPYPFECFFAAWVENAAFVEKQLHFAFGEQRVPSNREFFHVDANRVKAVLELVSVEEITQQVESEMTSELKALPIDAHHSAFRLRRFQLVQSYSSCAMKG